MRVPWEHLDAVRLREAMSDEMDALYSDQPEDESRDGIFVVDPSSIRLTEVLYIGGAPVGHVAVRELDGQFEIKRLYVVPEYRGTSAAADLLGSVEEWAHSTGIRRLILHTGERQVAAIKFYERCGFSQIPVFSPYQDVPFSLCYAKTIGSA